MSPKVGTGHVARISDATWDFLQAWAKKAAVRRKGVDLVGLSFNDILELYISDCEAGF